MRLEHAIARNMARLRNEQGWSQGDLASRMTTTGHRWTVNRVSSIEIGRRPISFLEVLALCAHFKVPIEALLVGEEPIDLPSGGTVSLYLLREALAGKDVDLERREPREDHAFVQRVASRLGVDTATVTRQAQRLYGRSLTEEREDRAAKITADRELSLKDRRANTTKALVAELQLHLND